METGTLSPDGVRVMFDRIAPVYDAMNRVMTAGLDRRWRELAAEVVLPGDRVLDACCGTGDLALAARRRGGVVTGLDFSPAMLERARAQVGGGRVGAGRPARAAVRRRLVRVGDRRLRRPQRRRPAARAAPSCAACSCPAAGSQSSRSPSRAACCGRSTGSGSTRSCRSSAACCPAAPPTPICRRACAASRGRTRSRRCMTEAGFDAVRYRLLAGSIVALHTGAAA